MFWAKKQVSICAIITTRNEFNYLQTLIPLLAEQNIDVAIIDNESSDRSYQLYSKYRNKPIISVDLLPYRGFYSLPDLLIKKHEIAQKIKHDWVIQQDSDEILDHYQSKLTLRDAIYEADERGYNALNFEEFVFLPEPNSDYSQGNHYTDLLRYYFFEPRKNRLNRAWKRISQLRNIQSGGHTLTGRTISIAPENHILRHYIVLNQDHARNKYLNRIYDPQAVVRGWHGNKMNFTTKNLALPEKGDLLFRLSKHDSKEFNRARPATKHFWEWEKITD